MTDHLGTPEITSFLSEIAPAKWVCWKRLYKYEENHEVSMLYSLSLWIKRLWSTRSKALEKSQYNEPAILFSLIALNQSSMILINAIWQEWCSLKPDCLK